MDDLIWYAGHDDMQIGTILLVISHDKRVHSDTKSFTDYLLSLVQYFYRKTLLYILLLDNYAPLVRTSGAQDLAKGKLSFLTGTKTCTHKRIS